MARPGIGYEEVKQAAVTLLTRGQNPSVQRVRDLLGTGSNTTISEHLKRWQQALVSSPKATLPDTVPETIMPAVEAFWILATEHAEAAYQTLKARAEAEVRETLERLAAAQQEAGVLHRQLQDTRAHADNLEQQLLAEQTGRQLAEKATVALQARLDATRMAADQIREEAERRTCQFQAELDQTRQAAGQAAREAEARLHYERERGEANEASLMGIIDQIRTEHGRQQRELVGERQAWQQRENALHQQLESLRQTSTSLQKSNAVLAAQSQRLEGELADVRGKLVEAEARQLKRARLAESLRKELNGAVLENRALSKALGNCRRALVRHRSPAGSQAPSNGTD